MLRAQQLQAQADDLPPHQSSMLSLSHILGCWPGHCHSSQGLLLSKAFSRSRMVVDDSSTISPWHLPHVGTMEPFPGCDILAPEAEIAPSPGSPFHLRRPCLAGMQAATLPSELSLSFSVHSHGPLHSLLPFWVCPFPQPQSHCSGLCHLESLCPLCVPTEAWGPIS